MFLLLLRALQSDERVRNEEEEEEEGPYIPFLNRTRPGEECKYLRLRRIEPILVEQIYRLITRARLIESQIPVWLGKEYLEDAKLI